MNRTDAVRAAAAKEERSKADWRPQDTAPPFTLVLVAIRKGSTRCPGRPEMYVAPAWKSTSGWTVFGLPQENQRAGESVEYWMPLPALPEGTIEADKDHKPTWDPPKRLDENAPSDTTEQPKEGGQ